jgi:ribosome-associated translation inhibitor RaiA
MHLTDHGHNLRIDLDTKGPDLPRSEIDRLLNSLSPLGKVVADFPISDLYITIYHHPRSGSYQVKTALVLSGQTLVSNTEDAHVHPAFERCVSALIEQVRAYKERLGSADELSKHRKGTYQEVLPSHEPDVAVIEQAVQAGDYAAFRSALLTYEEPLRKRVGRWMERHPRAREGVGREVAVADVVEAVFLDAFEGYDSRPAAVRLGRWLEGLIDGSLRELLRDPDAVLENVELARTLRDTPSGDA